MPILQKCLDFPCGAKFYRADLHIHSFGASHDVDDEQLTPTNIVATAVKENIDVIAVTDHNEISNVEAVIQSAKTEALGHSGRRTIHKSRAPSMLFADP